MDSLKTKDPFKIFFEKGINEGTLIENIFEKVQSFSLKILVVIAIYIISKYIISVLIKSLKALMVRKAIDSSLIDFLLKAISVSLKVVIFVVIIGVLGINTTSFIAVLASAGFAVGLALQGSLQNFAGGIIILFLKPFKVDDEIETSVGDFRGIVKEIGIFTTTLITFDNISIIIPNSELSTKTLINYTKAGVRRIDEIIGIDYGDSVDSAREILMKLVKNDKRIIKDRKVSIIVTELSDSSVNLKILAWTSRENYYSVKADLRENAHFQFKKQGITIPFPQIQIHN